eukprot:6283778-Karenia_brevis.AAC.1
MTTTGCESPIVWPARERCFDCNSALEKKTGKGYTHVASIWNGAEWQILRHSTKQCTKRGLRHKLNYAAKIGKKQNTLTDIDNNPTILLHAQFGLTFSYLVQLWHRMCCTGTTSAGE